MEIPISVVANVIAIADAAAKLSKAISDLGQSDELPSRLYALKNEATDLEVVLRQIASVINERGKLQRIDQASLRVVFERANTKLSELSQTLRRISDRCLNGNVKIIKRAASLKALRKRPRWFKIPRNYDGIMDSSRTAAIRLVLDAGAVPDPKIPNGLPRNPPILGTVMNGEEKSMLKTILGFGAKVDSCGPERTTARHAVVAF
ncbi:hypothetical protein F4779DRAFT_616679 [Xylariaceae sp. FL0662B]|nr:hypothetical protein F4779DRAFT_616679 [Xylariaceae sp. FL0662B]